MIILFLKRTVKLLLCHYTCLITTAFFFFLLFSSFSSVAQFTTQGDASKETDRCFMITPNKQHAAGAIWATDKFDLTKPQRKEFQIYLGSKNELGADGMAFVLQNDSRGTSALGSEGEGMGFGFSTNDNSKRIISPSVAIELDTWENVEGANDLPGTDHTTVVYNGDLYSEKHPIVPISASEDNVEDNTCHDIVIEWDPGTHTLTMSFDGSVRISHTDDIVNKVFSGQSEVYYGFTASTGYGSNQQSVSIKDPDSKPIGVDDVAEAEPGKEVAIPAAQNDTHTKGTPVAVSRVISVDGGGIAYVSGGNVMFTPSAQKAPATYTIVYELKEDVPAGCCPKYAQAKIIVNVACKTDPAPFAITPAGPLTVCSGDELKLRAPVHPDATIVWSRDGVDISGNSPTLAVTESGDYTVRISTVCVNDQPATNTVSVTVNPTPPTPVAEGATRCGKGTVILTASNGTDGEYRWYDQPKNSPPLPDAVNGTFETPEIDTTTTYYVTSVRNGCETERVPVVATVLPAPDLPLLTTIVIEPGDTVQLKSEEGPYTYLWSPSEGLSNPLIHNPIAQPEESTTYTVVIKTAQGCEITAQTRVVVRQEIAIPNAFSPNGDGINDTWTVPTLEGYPDAYIEIFDRWGTKVFERVGYYNQWNGTYNGKPLPQSTYYYVITLKDQKITGSVSIVY
jgi:gliding motility-associated-like protein